MLAASTKRPATLILPVSLFFIGWWMALPSKPEHSQKNSDGGQLQEWTCSMHPQIRQPNFGLCPICNMDLIPLEGGATDGGLRELNISSEAAALLDLRVSPVLRAPAAIDIKLFGNIDYDERSIVTTTARMSGRLDRLYADFTGTLVSKGDAIGEIYSPELIITQHTLINARADWENSTSATDKKENLRTLKSAREKMRLLNLSEAQVATIEILKKPKQHITILAPQSGVIVSLNAKEGQYLKTGDPLFGIANLKTVWLKMEAYESDLTWLRYGQKASFTIEAIPGKTFHGRIAFVDPQLDPNRRIAMVRVNVDNENLMLKPGMFANASVQVKVSSDGHVISADLAGKWISPMHPEIVKDGPGKCDICGMPLVPAEKFGFVASDKTVENPLLIPASAVLRTGKRAIVYVRIPGKVEPVFEGREIVLGPKTGDFFIVNNGLDAGELVVTKGAYKLDSELQLKARPSMMNPNAGLEERSSLRSSDQISGQWSPVLRAYGKLEQSIEKGDPISANRALASMQHALNRIQHDQLQPKELSLWKEFSMRLNNTLTITKSRAMDRSTLAIVRDQMKQTSRYLGLPWKPLPSISPDKHWLAPLKGTTGAYLVLSKALSDDKMNTAIKAIPALAAAAQKLPDDDGKKNLLRAIGELQKAEKIKALRKAFKQVSDTLILLIRQHGVDHLGNLYVIHCPMAFRNTGADWLSHDPMVRNPYFGDMMYACGTVTDTLSLGSSKPKTMKPHMDHSNH